MDAKSVLEAVRTRIRDVPEDNDRFEVPEPANCGEEDGVFYVSVRYRRPFDASHRYELYVRLSAIETDIREKTGKNVSLVAGGLSSEPSSRRRQAA